jgi:hypothetical protein
MGKFAEQMSSLTESVVASRQDCILTVKEMMSKFDREQAEMARQQKSSLAAGSSARKHQIDSMRREYRNERQRMGRDLRRGLAQATNQISISVASLLAGSSKEHAAMAKAQQAQFTRDGQARVKGNDSLMSEFSVSRQNMAQALSQNLASFTLSIQNGTDVMLGGFRQAQGEMAGQLRETLSANTATIRGNVIELKSGFNEVRNELRDDMQAAAKIWGSRNRRRTVMPGQAARVAAKVEEGTGAFGMMGKVMGKLGVGAHVTEAPAGHPETEVKVQPNTHESQMSDAEKVLQVVRGNPSGISATQIGEKVSLPAMEVGKIMKELIGKGKALRDDGTRLFTSIKGG